MALEAKENWRGAPQDDPATSAGPSLGTRSPLFDAHHAPIGTFSTLTFGAKGSQGGLGMELSGPADERFYVGCEQPDAPGHYLALPFFDALDSESALDFDVEGRSDFHHQHRVSTFPRSASRVSLGPLSTSGRQATSPSASSRPSGPFQITIFAIRMSFGKRSPRQFFAR